MAERLASLSDVKVLLRGTVNDGTAEEKALAFILDGVSTRMISLILKSPQLSWKQNQFIESYGTEHYGFQDRDTIRLDRAPVVTIDEVDDDGTIVDAADYVTNANSAILRLLGGKRFTNEVEAVQVTYTAGWAETGVEDQVRLAVPDDLRLACAQMTQRVYSDHQIGVQIGVISKQSGESNWLFETVEFPAAILATLKRYRI